MRIVAALVVVSLVVTACTQRPSVPENTASSFTEGATPTTVAEDPGTTTATTARTLAVTEPDLTLEADGLSPYLPTAVGPDAVISYTPPAIAVHTEAGTTTIDVTAIAPEIGEFFDVSSIVWWSGRFWAFLVGDVSTEVGVASALTSPDGVTWKRVEIGLAAGGARLPGAFATPEVPQYDGVSGVQAAAATDDRLVVGGWTRTDAGVQPVVWITEDGQNWSVETPPSIAERAMAVRVAPANQEILVHVLGPFHFGQDLYLLSDGEPTDVSLVGDQFVTDIVRSEDGFVMSTSAFGGPPTGLWEWDGSAWQSIAAPDIDPRSDDGAEIEPYHLAGSEHGAVITGDRGVAIRSDGAWMTLGSVRGSIIDATVLQSEITLLSLEGDDLLVTSLPLP